VCRCRRNLDAPDPQRPGDDEDRTLLAHLRLSEARWPALTLELPAPESFADEVSDGKETTLKWGTAAARTV
jgi:hypothetical protein